jgi:hypothetical protein
MMLMHSKGLWRIEYRSDLTRAQGPVLPIGYVLESRWSNNVRWLGMLFRKRLTPIEVDHVDLKTWPEMAGLEPFMTRLFGEVWEQTLGIDGDVPQLGAPMLAVNYSMRSSLQFVTDKADLKLSNEDPEKSFANLYTRLLGLHGALTPTLKAPVVQLPPPRKLTPAAAKAARPDVEQLSRAA